MARFIYQARDSRGELATGVVNADDIDHAGQLLRADGKFVVKLTAAKQTEAAAEAVSVSDRAKKVKRREVIFFAHQMAVMIETGVPLSDALECAGEQTGNPNFKAVLKDVTATVQAGGEFSAALKKYPKVFPPVMTSLLRASEMSGTMASMMERISQYMTKEQQTIRQARGAMMYPMFMCVMAIGVTIFLLTFVLPRFAGIYESRKAVLPAPTRLLLGISGFMVEYWYTWVGGIIALFLLYFFGRKTGPGRRFLDKMKLSLPLVGGLYTQLYITRAASTMGTMINAGVSMLDMINIVRKVTVNVYYEELWDEIDMQLRQGAQLSDPMFRSKLIPRSIAQMVYSGEKSGQLGKVMNRVAAFTEAEFDQTVKNTTAMIEPIMVAVMGTIIGFVAISMLLPIFSVSRVVAG